MFTVSYYGELIVCVIVQLLLFPDVVFLALVCIRCCVIVNGWGVSGTLQFADVNMIQLHINYNAVIYISNSRARRCCQSVGCVSYLSWV